MKVPMIHVYVNVCICFGESTYESFSSSRAHVMCSQIGLYGTGSSNYIIINCHLTFINIPNLSDTP